MSLEDELFEAKVALLESILESPDVEMKGWNSGVYIAEGSYGIEFFVGEYTVRLQECFSAFRGVYFAIDSRPLSRELNTKVKAAVQRIRERRMRNEMQSLRSMAKEVAARNDDKK